MFSSARSPEGNHALSIEGLGCRRDVSGLWFPGLRRRCRIGMGRSGIWAQGICVRVWGKRSGCLKSVPPEAVTAEVQTMDCIATRYLLLYQGPYTPW